jgi:hypothetical protein
LNPAAVIDHLWQSLLFGACAWSLAWLTRRNPAALRLWLWRLAALKFALPFALLFELGAWLGFPVRHSAVPPPAFVVHAVSQSLRVVSPAQSMAPSIPWLVTALGLVLPVTGLFGRRIVRELRCARQEHEEECARVDRDWSDRRPPPGFINTAILTTTAIVSLSAPIIAGAVTNRLWRQEALAVDTHNMLSARIDMVEADPGRGPLSNTVATSEGVLIRNINIQDLVALVYGIEQFEVFGGALPWLESPRYDVRVTGPVRRPEVFDAYSLRQPVTKYLAERFGASIRVNGDCQEPCINQQSFVIERLR